MTMIVPSIVILLLSRPHAVAGARPAFPLPLASSSSSSSSSPDPEAEDRSYAKYDAYPPYCAVPDEMERRAVPPLPPPPGDDDEGDGSGSSSLSSRLVHVTALIRHGARTPWAGAPDYRCWDGYWESPETGVWNCDLKTYVSPPAASKERKAVDDEGGLVEEEPDFLFEKRYDALRVSEGRTGNGLNGTCQLGQLIMRGYDQELRNGRHLRQAYFYDGENTADGHAASDPRMRLWDLTRNGDDGDDGVGGGDGKTSSTPTVGDPTKPIYQEPNLRYRAKDMQRTLMSGQVFLRGLFEPELLEAGKDDDESAVIRLHTADAHLDVFTINERLCPRTRELRDAAYASEEYARWSASSEVATVKRFAREELGMDEIPGGILDCLMTTICTDRPLPEVLDDYDGSLGPTPWEEGTTAAVEGGGSEEYYATMFERVYNYAVKNYTFPYVYDDAALPKLGMGPLWKEILANILPIVDATNHPPAAADAPPPKLALFSGHDTTLMPLLATLGEEVWDGTEWMPYAAMVQIEIHEMSDSSEGSPFPSGYAFRLLSNGMALTGRVDGCDAGADLCDSRRLLERTMPFAKYVDRDCASSAAPPPDGPDGPEEGLVEEMKEATETFVVAPGGTAAFALLIVASMALGSAVTYLLMNGKTRRTHGYKKSWTLGDALGDLSMSEMSDGENHFEKVDENAII